MRELSVGEQRYLAVLAVIAEGHPVSSVAQQWGVSRQTLSAWLGRYEADGLEGRADRIVSAPVVFASEHRLRSSAQLSARSSLQELRDASNPRLSGPPSESYESVACRAVERVGHERSAADHEG